jgi:plasmid stabilization system protein ParE
VTRTLRSDELASEELLEAVLWYERQRVGLGAELFDAVLTTISLLDTHDEAGSPIGGDPRTRRLLVNRFPYQVVYRLRESEIVIVAVAHLKRRPGYWRHRK